MTTQPSDSSEAKDSTKGGDNKCAITTAPAQDRPRQETTVLSTDKVSIASNAAPRSEPLDAASPLPCPFCGKAIIRTLLTGSVCCETDYCPASYAAVTLERWNRRTTPGQQTADGLPAASLKELWETDAPQGLCWKCPDCELWATLGGNAGFHVGKSGHSLPSLRSIPANEPTPPQPEAQGTPRTDAMTALISSPGGAFIGHKKTVSRGFARKLETELAAERAARQVAEQLTEEFRLGAFNARVERDALQAKLAELTKAKP